MLTQWLEDAHKVCVKSNYTILRRSLLERFAKENNLSDSRVIPYLSRISYSNTSTIRDVFASKFAGEGTHGSRDTLIQGAVHMGCSLDEANTLLREANHALLYPFREDNTDARSIALLLRNELARKQREEELQKEQKN